MTHTTYNAAGCTTILAATAILLALPQAAHAAPPGNGHGKFTAAATYDIAGEAAEIVASTPDGNLLIYTDGEGENLGFVDITDVGNPVETLVPVDGGPTSVTITPDGAWALVVVHDGEDIIELDEDPETPPDEIQPERNYLLAIDLSDMSETIIPLGGQPDSVAVSPDGLYAAICIENERDEDVDDGLMPQSPAGFLTIVDLWQGGPGDWTMRDVDFTGLAMRFPTDPEPEFVDINADNLAAVTLQENNHIAIVDLITGSIVSDFTAGTTTHGADLDDDDIIRFNDRLVNARLEPDGISWAPGGFLITANEGDYDLDLADGEFVGGRNWSIFNAATGSVVYDCGATLEMAAAKLGLYPDGRSDAKGVEPEGAEVGTYGSTTYAFIGAERGSFVAIYELLNGRITPRLLQILPTGNRPEGLLAIPARNLFVTSNEGDGSISVFSYQP